MVSKMERKNAREETEIEETKIIIKEKNEENKTIKEEKKAIKAQLDRAEEMNEKQKSWLE